MNRQESLKHSKNDYWPGDVLNRDEDAELIYRWVNARLDAKQARDQTRSTVLNIEAEWGYGKTFFVEGFAKFLRKRGHLVAEINAWSTDFVDDPFVAVLSEIDTVIQPYLNKSTLHAEIRRNILKTAGKVGMAVATGFASQMARKYIGQSIDELFEKAEEHDDNAEKSLAKGSKQARKEV